MHVELAARRTALSGFLCMHAIIGVLCATWLAGPSLSVRAGGRTMFATAPPTQLASGPRANSCIRLALTL